MVVCFWLGVSLFTVCFQLGQTLLVLGSNLKEIVCGLVAWFPSAYIVLSVWLQFPCAWFQVASSLVPVCLCLDLR